MQVQILGKKKVEFTNDEGKMTRGVNLFFCGTNPDVEGLICDKKWISDADPLYPKAFGLDVTDPIIDATFVYEIVLGKAKPVLVDIEV